MENKYTVSWSSSTRRDKCWQNWSPVEKKLVNKVYKWAEFSSTLNEFSTNHSWKAYHSELVLQQINEQPANRPIKTNHSELVLQQPREHSVKTGDKKSVIYIWIKKSNDGYKLNLNVRRTETTPNAHQKVLAGELFLFFSWRKLFTCLGAVLISKRNHGY